MNDARQNKNQKRKKNEKTDRAYVCAEVVVYI